VEGYHTVTYLGNWYSEYLVLTDFFEKLVLHEHKKTIEKHLSYLHYLVSIRTIDMQYIFACLNTIYLTINRDNVPGTVLLRVVLYS